MVQDQQPTSNESPNDGPSKSGLPGTDNSDPTSGQASGSAFDQTADQAGGQAGGQASNDALAEAQAKAKENYDLYVRSVAEMENIRRRAAEDVSKAHKYAVESFAEAVLPVRDSLEMALKVADPTVQSFKDGVEATLRQLISAFEKNRLLELDPVGEKFDPNRHQAISMVPVATAHPPTKANHIVTVLQKGYLINDRILRPALVIVAQG